MTQPPQAQGALFQLVLAKFKASLSEKDRKRFGATTLKDLHIAIESIQQKQKSEKKLRAMSKLGRFLEGMHEYGKIVEVFLNTSEILAFVWGPMKFLLQVASTFYEAFDTLLEAYRRIGEHMYLLKQYELYFQHRPDMGNPLMLMYEDILEFHSKALKFFEKKMWRQLFQALWKTFEFEFGGLLRNMREHMDMIQRQATIAQFTEITGAQHLIKLNMESQKQQEKLRRREFVHQWLATANCEADQETFTKVRQQYPATGGWIFGVDRFNSWFDPMYCSTHLLWINGIPGAGKTILASAIVEAARNLPDVSVVFFYCRFKDSNRDTFISLARGILAQLAVLDEDLLTYLYDKASSSGQITLSSETMAKDLLKVSMQNFEKLYMIVDGLDECDRDERKQIASFFENLWNSLPQKDQDSLRCCFLSQDDNVARKDHAQMSWLKITESHTRKDIQSYAEARSEEIKTKFDLSSDRQQYVQDKITSMAEGMFLFAHLMASFLFDQTSVDQLEDELSPGRFPDGPEKLNELYSRIISRLSKGRDSLQTDSLKVFTWMVCAKRPLKWHEIQCLQAIDVENQCVDWEYRKFRVETKELCGSLAEVHVDGTIVLIHRTAKAFLTEKKLVDVNSGELALSTICVSYLALPGFDNGMEDTEIDTLVSSGYYGLLDYAYAYWARHLDAFLRIESTEDDLEGIREAIEGFLELLWMEPQTRTVIPKSFLERWKKLKLEQNHDNLVLAGYLGHRQLVVSAQRDSSEQVLTLHNTIKTIRGRLEELWYTKRDILIPMYGENVYKCPRVDCTRFYNGFDTSKGRDEHFPKHDRTYFCSFPGCHTSILGCATLKELHKHENEYHNALVIDEEEAEYPELPAEKVSFQCKQCDKKFTRNNNLKIHMKRVHGGPNTTSFMCSQCGKSFARLGDRTRHEGTIHSVGKDYTCGGTLQSGDPWGCGRKFNRGDMLNRHWTSEKGKLCIAPKQQEELAEAATPASQDGTGSQPVS